MGTHYGAILWGDNICQWYTVMIWGSAMGDILGLSYEAVLSGDAMGQHYGVVLWDGTVG